MVVKKMSRLEFEKPIIELQKKIDDLYVTSGEEGIDLGPEIASLEARLQKLKKQIYANIKPWDKVQISRHSERPTTLDYIPRVFEEFFECKGDRVFGEDNAIVGGIAMFLGEPVTVIGHQRGRDTKENLLRNFGMPHPEGYRKALRLMKQANKFGRPIICLIDTKGAYPGKAAEERGQSEAIATNLFEMAGFKVPIISIVIGEGGSGGALALGVADKILMLENATYSVISPEGAASILWKDAAKAKQAAESLKLTAEELQKLGIVDGVISEASGGAQNDVDYQAQQIGMAIKASLEELSQLNGDELVENRYNKYKDIGVFSTGNK